MASADLNIVGRIIEDEGRFTPVEEAEAVAAWRERRGAVWIDLECEDNDNLAEWLLGLGVDPALVSAARAPDSTGRVMPFPDSVFFEYPVPDAEGAPALVGCVALEGLVVTMHHRRIARDDDETILARMKLGEASISALVCAMVLNQSLRLRRAALGLRDQARRMSADMDDDPGSVPLTDILALKRRLLDTDRMADEQMAVFEIIQALDKPHLDLRSLTDTFHLAVGNVQAADRRLERLDRAVMGLQQRYESLQQDKTNKRLGFLTIISAIFMPLTLVVGIYGMNFDHMPELHFRYGYFFALGGMFAIAVGLLWFFRARKWLD